MRATLLICQVTQLPATPTNPNLEEQQGLPAFADELEDRQLLKYFHANLLIITLLLQTDMLVIAILFQTEEQVITLALQTDMVVITLPLQTDVLVITHHQLKEENAIPLHHQLKEELALILLLQHPLSLCQR